jgi:hypothetical protein
LEVHFASGQPPVHCESLADLDATLDRLHGECDPRYPILVCIALPEHRLDIGLGADPTFLIVNTQPCDGEYWISVGDERAEGHADFYGCGTHQQLARRHFIHLEMARQAIREFVRTGRVGPGIQWQDWAGRAAQPGSAPDPGGG